MAIVIKLNKEPATPKYEDVALAASKLTAECTPAQINAVLCAAAKAHLGPIEEDMVLTQVHLQTKLGKKPIRVQYNDEKQKVGLMPDDPGLTVARHVRSEYFNNGKFLTRRADGCFLEFIGTHWVEIDEASIKQIVFEESSKVFPASGEKRLSGLVASAMSCLISILGVDESFAEPMADAPAVVNVKNGEVWIDSDGEVELRPHDPATRSTYCLPIEFDPLATSPIFDQALSEVFSKAKDPEGMGRHFIELFGYAIQPIRNIPTFVMLIGQGANGKTKLLETLQTFLTPDAVLCDSISKFTGDQFNVAYLQDKLVFIDDDLTDGTKLNDGLLKKISESKTMSARRAYGKKKVTFKCRALPIMAGNNFPTTSDVSPGMLRRAQIIPFDRVFAASEQDVALFPTIWVSEMPGILNKALAGLKSLRTRGNQFDPPVDCLKARIEFFKHANPLVAFIDDRCVEQQGAKTRLKDMREALKSWATEQGIKKPAAADNTLKRKLDGLGYKVSMINGYATVSGLVLKPSFP